ncbi:MAG: hypothetical protein GF341_02380 [candidate division Zixibacteria bacterium]|nr:hypothetical protein [candidate division Zixibacteria bacterium]
MTASISPERQLTNAIADELTFYRELFFLTDKQRDALQQDSPGDIPDIQQEITAVQSRIEQSEQTLRQLRDQSPDEFDRVIRSAPVAAALANITELIKRTQDVVADCAQIAARKKAEYQTELGQIGVGRMLLSGMNKSAGEPQFIDQRP